MQSLKTSLVALLLLTSVSLFSQRKNSLTISIGASQPVGRFASTSLVAGIQPGYAGTGLFADVLFQKRISQSGFSASAILGLQTNSFKINTLLKNYRQNRGQFEWSGKSSPWLTIALMPGICYSTPISKKASFNAGLFTGAAVTHSASYNIDGVIVNGGSGNAKAVQESAWNLTITNRFTTAVQFEVGKKTTLVIQASYNYLKPTFKKIVQTYTQVTGTPGSPIMQLFTTRYEAPYTQTITTINVGAGIVLQL